MGPLPIIVPKLKSSYFLKCILGKYRQCLSEAFVKIFLLHNTNYSWGQKVKKRLSEVKSKHGHGRSYGPKQKIGFSPDFHRCSALFWFSPVLCSKMLVLRYQWSMNDSLKPVIWQTGFHRRMARKKFKLNPRLKF